MVGIVARIEVGIVGQIEEVEIVEGIALGGIVVVVGVVDCFGWVYLQMLVA